MNHLQDIQKTPHKMNLILTQITNLENKGLTTGEATDLYYFRNLKNNHQILSLREQKKLLKLEKKLTQLKNNNQAIN